MMHQSTYPLVNWIDGMKLSKDNFITLQNAQIAFAADVASVNTSPFKYGVIEGADNFNVQISVDNQNTVRASVINCKAITLGGMFVNIDKNVSNDETDGTPSVIFPLTNSNSEAIFWLVLTTNPFNPVPYGEPDTNEDPPRFPFIKPTYKLELITQSNYNQFAQNPLSLTLGKILVNGNTVAVDEEYIPPCVTVKSSYDLVSLHSELDSFYASLEQLSSNIVQKIYKKSQQNDLSQLVLFLCDRIIIALSPIITSSRWSKMYETPSSLIQDAACLARSIKNTISLRSGSGKDELLNYISEWSDISQGEFENLLTSIAEIRYNHNDINANIRPVVRFVKVINTLFQTLNNLEFIGKRKETGIFIKEEHNTTPEAPQEQSKPKRRFFG